MPLGRVSISILLFFPGLLDAALPRAKAGFSDQRSVSLRAASPESKQADKASTTRTSHAAKNRAKLEIHYETLCPYCSTLIGESLQTIWNDEEFRERIDVALFPAGNMNSIPASEVSEGYKFFHAELTDKGLGYVFQCQHGEQECLGNMIQACIMKSKSEAQDHLPTLFCIESRLAEGDSIEKVAFECMKETDIDVHEVLSCTQTAAANDMMYLISNYSNSLSPQRQYVPWVTIDGEHFEDADAGDLLGPLCRSLAPPVPAACDKAETQRRGGIVGKIGHWFGGIQETGSASLPRPNRTGVFCYP